MDNKDWINNKIRFEKKMNLMDSSFCTTCPKVLNLSNKKVYYIPNPVDENFENLKIYKNKFFQYDLFFAMSHGVHRGTLKKAKLIKEKFF